MSSSPGFSVYVEPETASELVTASISWYTSSNTLISTVNGLPTQCPPTYNITQAVLSGNIATITLNEPYEFLNYAGNDKSYILVSGLGSPYDGTWEISSILNNTVSYARVNTNIALATISGTASPVGIWYRVSTTDTAPSNAAKASVRLSWTPSTSGAVVYLEDALFEKASFVLDYFDGSRSGQEDSTSLVWEGVVEASRSHFYKNKFAVEDRLKREISKNILLGSTFALYFAQPD